MKSVLIIFCLTLQCAPALANYGYCFTNGTMGGTKVFIHESVRDADFWDGATVTAYRSGLEQSHRFRFGPLSCPGFDTEDEARESLASARSYFLGRGFAEFVYPIP